MAHYQNSRSLDSPVVSHHSVPASVLNRGAFHTLSSALFFTLSHNTLILELLPLFLTPPLNLDDWRHLDTHLAHVDYPRPLLLFILSLVFFFFFSFLFFLLPFPFPSLGSIQELILLHNGRKNDVVQVGGTWGWRCRKDCTHNSS